MTQWETVHPQPDRAAEMPYAPAVEIREPSVLLFLSGATARACLVVCLFFLRFWRESTDRLFAYFATAFWLLGANYAVIGVAHVGAEGRPYVFLLRLLAFGAIIVGIVSKNRETRTRRG